MTDKQQKLWEKCIAFHGHACGGLAIGLQASAYASELLDLSFSKDEDVLCVTENDACCVDAIQVALGCSVGKGNLLFRMRGKMAFSFFNRKTGQSVRLMLKNLEHTLREERMEYLLKTSCYELFEKKEVAFGLPEPARIFQSYACEQCGEVTAENALRIENGKKICLDCYHPYQRFS